MKVESSSDCSGRLCGYGEFKGSLGCDTGPGSCWQANMLEADVSSFHDECLQDATAKIGEILKNIPPDPAGRKLSFVHTRSGSILAWVLHGINLPDDAVTIESDPEEVKRALKIKY